MTRIKRSQLFFAEHESRQNGRKDARCAASPPAREKVLLDEDRTATKIDPIVRRSCSRMHVHPEVEREIRRDAAITVFAWSY